MILIKHINDNSTLLCEKDFILELKKEDENYYWIIKGENLYNTINTISFFLKDDYELFNIFLDLYNTEFKRYLNNKNNSQLEYLFLNDKFKIVDKDLVFYSPFTKHFEYRNPDQLWECADSVNMYNYYNFIILFFNKREKNNNDIKIHIDGNYIDATKKIFGINNNHQINMEEYQILNRKKK